MILHIPAVWLQPGDKVLDNWVGANECGECGAQEVYLVVRRRWFRPMHYWWIAKKYWRMNPTKLWWLGHVWDHFYHGDWKERHRKPCQNQKTACVFC